MEKEKEKEIVLNEEQYVNEEEAPEENLTNTQETESLDKEEVISAFLSGDDERLYALLSPLGFSEEEIKSAKEKFVEAARKSLFRRDLKEILSKYRLGVSDIRDIPNYQKYAMLRANGFSAIEAFESANPKMTLNSGKGSREHMAMVSSRQGSSGDVPIPEKELGLWRSAFPKASIEELTKRYNKARNA